jgi:hypothetical protein
VTRGRCTFHQNDCAKFCAGTQFFTCHAFEDSCVDGSVPAGPVIVDCSTCPGGGGRRPEGLERWGAAPPRTTGALFAELAYLEAASVEAFRRLRRELRDAGAPRDLVRGVERAMRDEVRHARVTARLAGRRGARCRKPRAVRSARRSLEALAIENAIEGCVRETYGAALASWQAEHAQDRDVVRVMTRIATDEARHAALAWAIAAWLEPRLDRPAQSRVARCRSEAARQVLEQWRPPPSPAMVRGAGVPTGAEERALLRVLDATLWRPATPCSVPMAAAI